MEAAGELLITREMVEPAERTEHPYTVEIEAAAKVTVIENRNQSLRFAKWRPYAPEAC